MSYALNLITAPSEEPVTLAETKTHLKIDSNTKTDDTYIENILIPYARQYLERYTHRALIAQTWELVYSCDQYKIQFPLGQLTAVNSVIVVAEDGTESTQSATLYSTTLNTDKGRLWLKSGSTWSTSERDFDNFIVNFTCGWADADSLPAEYKNAVLALCAYFYENRQYRDPDVADTLIQQSGVGKLFT